MLSDLRESGSIEQDADMVVFVHRLTSKTELVVAKHRNGPPDKVTLFHDTTRLVYLEQMVEFPDEDLPEIGMSW